MVNVHQHNLQEFVSEDGAAVRKAKERVVGEHCLHTQCAGMQDTLMTQSTECLEEGEREGGREGRREREESIPTI